MNDKKFEATRRYNQTAEVYDNRYRNIQFSKFREIIPELEFDKSRFLIDVGGGTGLILEYLKGSHQNIIVCDISLEMLKIGKSKSETAYFVCADSEALPFRNTCSDIVCFFSVFQNLESPDLSLHESFRILKSKGQIAVAILSKLFLEDKIINNLKSIGYRIVRNWQLPLEDSAIVGEKD